jgi:radical SAM superfamily enzyme YgiQ (UPF0313 family)
MARKPNILLVNPWITDFAAHDLWAKPVGLLILGALLRQGGYQVTLVDCLNRHDAHTTSHPEVLPGSNRRYGTGKYPRMRLARPEAYGDFPRHYYRYGIHPESLQHQLQPQPKPDMIWVTSMMTYWYPGVQQTIAEIRRILPEVPIWLGGIYVKLCPQHARERSGADRIITAPIDRLPAMVEATTGVPLQNRRQWQSFGAYPFPALDLVPNLQYAPILTSCGCPYRCPYCAARALSPLRERRSADLIYREIIHWYQDHGIVDFAFYDDALLLDAETTLRPVLERLTREGLPLRFHTPNALHIRALTPEWCALLKESGFTTLRLGLESTHASRQKEWGGKVETEMFAAAMANLLAAGFESSQIGVYLLCGLPGQSPAEIEESIVAVRKAGGQPYLAEYSPLPGTLMWSQAIATCGYDIASEPLYHNNSFFACRRPDFTYDDLLRLKELARQARHLESTQ